MSQTMLRNLAVLTKEMRTRMRGSRASVVISVYLLILSSIGAWMIYSQQRELRSGFNASTASDIGLQTFIVLSMLQLFLVVFIVPGLTGPAIAGERDRQTLDLLLSTQVSALWIVLGKILASLSYIFLLLLAALPLFSMAFLFGGVSPGQIALAFVISLVSALTLGAIGVFLSVLIRRGPTATVLAYAVTFLLLIGTPVLSIFISMSIDPRGTIRPEIILPLALNPMAALASATMPSILPDAALLGTSASGTRGGLALWHLSLMVDAVLIVLFVLLASTILRPGLPRLLRRRPQPARIEP